MNLYKVGNDLDDVGVYLHRIINLLHIYEERIECEVEFLKENDTSGTARYFIDRYDLLRSLMDTIQNSAYDTAESLQKQIDAIYAAYFETQHNAS